MELDKIYLGDAYELIKQVPDKSVDLVIIDPPYEFKLGGKGKCEMTERANKLKEEVLSLDTESAKQEISKDRQAYLDYVKKNGKDEEAERLRVIANARDNRKNTKFISKGFTNEILDQCVRIMKKINIYIYMV